MDAASSLPQESDCAPCSSLAFLFCFSFLVSRARVRREVINEILFDRGWDSNSYRRRAAKRRYAERSTDLAITAAML